jgi:hypothetical protein
MIASKSAGEPANAAPFLLAVHELGFDVAILVSDYQRILQEHLSGEPGDAPTVISFTHRRGACNPILDGGETQYDQTTGMRKFAESEFCVFNEKLKNTAFYDLYQALPFTVGRMRVRTLRPGIAMAMHRDPSPRAHVALVTNPHCFLTSELGQSYHVPADGNVYVLDTRLPHTAFNASREERLHLTIALADEEIILN